MQPSHIQSAASPGWVDELGRQLAEVANLMVIGEIPEVIKPYICGARLAVSPKP